MTELRFPEEQARLDGEEINFALAAPDEPAPVLGGASVYNVDRAASRASCGPTLPFKDARRDTVVFSLLPGDLR